MGKKICYESIDIDYSKIKSIDYGKIRVSDEPKLKRFPKGKVMIPEEPKLPIKKDIPMWRF